MKNPYTIGWEAARSGVLYSRNPYDPVSQSVQRRNWFMGYNASKSDLRKQLKEKERNS